MCLRAGKTMKSIIKPLGVSMVLGCATVALAQSTGPKIDRVDVKFVGPAVGQRGVHPRQHQAQGRRELPARPDAG